MKARLVRLRCFVFDNAFLQKSCLFVDLVCFFSLRLRVTVFLNATRSDRSVHCLPLREKVDQCNSKGVHDCPGNYRGFKTKLIARLVQRQEGKIYWPIFQLAELVFFRASTII